MKSLFRFCGTKSISLQPKLGGYAPVLFQRGYHKGNHFEPTPNEQILKNLFDHFDKNGDSTIDIHELKIMFDAAGRVMTEKQLADLTRGFDSHSGAITFVEFSQIINKFKLDNQDSINLLNFWLETTRTEVKDAKLVFDSVWKKSTETNTPTFPKYIYWLGGSPGSGKSTSIEFISKMRGIHTPPIVIANLLNSPSAKQMKESGVLVGDSEVMLALLEELTKNHYQDAALVDGFPRTPLQAECVKLFYDELLKLHKSDSTRYEKPIFRAIMLYVGEKESVNRQLQRGKEVLAHNQQVSSTGMGDVIPIRPSDIDVTAARNRFKTFLSDTFKALTILKGFFPFSFIDAQGTIEKVRENIAKEMAYQSSLELNSETYDCLKHLPTSFEIMSNSKQSLVKRLESYQAHHQVLFKKVIEFLGNEVYSVICMHVMSGEASFISYEKMFDDKMAIQMVLDVLADRGFVCISEKHGEYIKFKIKFQKSLSSDVPQRVL